MDCSVQITTPDTTNPPTKKCKTKHQVLSEIFEFHTQKEAKMTDNLVQALDLQPTTIKLDTGSSLVEFPCMSSSTHINNLISSQPSKIVEVIPTVEATHDPENQETGNLYDEYLNNCLLHSQSYKKLLNRDYQEITDNQLQLINTDWEASPQIKFAIGKILSESILVEDKKVLLLNTIELYPRSKLLDTHHEKSIYDSSIPVIKSRYPNALKISIKHHDNSMKLLIGTNVFNALITSSLRLDIEGAEAEVGASTTNFTPSLATKLYIPGVVNKLAMENLKNTTTTFYNHALISQIRQLRSKFDNPSTYMIARCSSPFTNNLLSQPLTIYTVAEFEGKIEPELKLGSRIMRTFASAALYNKGQVKIDQLKNLVTNDENQETKIQKHLNHLITINSGREYINVMGNKDMNRTLTDIAAIMTPKLADYNAKIKKNIKKSIIRNLNY